MRMYSSIFVLVRRSRSASSSIRSSKALGSLKLIWVVSIKKVSVFFQRDLTKYPIGI